MEKESNVLIYFGGGRVGGGGEGIEARHSLAIWGCVSLECRYDLINSPVIFALHIP